MAKRKPSLELYYDPADLDPEAPRLHIRKDEGVWELRDADDALLSRSMLLPDVLDAALERSNARFSEIIVQGAGGGIEWSVHQNPECVELARVLARDRAPWPVSLSAAMDAGTLQLTFDPDEVDVRAPKLHVRNQNGEWEIRSVTGVLSTHPTQEEALATARSRVPDCGAEIFFESRSGRFLHRVARSPAELHYLDVCQNLYEDHHALAD